MRCFAVAGALGGSAGCGVVRPVLRQSVLDVVHNRRNGAACAERSEQNPSQKRTPDGHGARWSWCV